MQNHNEQLPYPLEFRSLWHPVGATLGWQLKTKTPFVLETRLSCMYSNFGMSLEIRDSLRDLYLEDQRPWLVGFSGGKDSTMLASPIFGVAKSIACWQCNVAASFCS